MMELWRRLAFRLPELRLEGERIVLRPPALEDFGSWANLRAGSQDFLVPWEPEWPRDSLSFGHYRRRQRQAERDWRDGAAHGFHIFARSDGALVGAVTLRHIVRAALQGASVGYWVGQPHARKGYMTEALALTLDHAFGPLGLHRVEAACLPENEASVGLVTKLGFQREGLARRYIKINGAWRDHALFAMLADDWRGKKG